MKKLLFILLVKIITKDIILHRVPCPANQESHIAIVDEGLTVPFDDGINFPLMNSGICLGLKFFGIFGWRNKSVRQAIVNDTAVC